MEVVNHLEKMGRELKCPICLSLLKSSVSLSCNHVFCNFCIVKNMKFDSSCPVCKVPYVRRDVRAAPHMDNLVNIYKGMEIASGHHIFISQNQQQIVLPEQRVMGDEHANSVRDAPEKTHGMVEINIGSVTEDICLTYRRKRVREIAESALKDSSPTVTKPSFPTKKRIQVQQCLLSKTSLLQEMESRSFDNPALIDTVEPDHSSFFWLRDDNNDDDNNDDHNLESTPPNLLAFRDVAEKNTCSPSNSTSNAEGCHQCKATEPSDNEIFKLEVEDSEEMDVVKENKLDNSSLNANTRMGQEFQNESYMNVNTHGKKAKPHNKHINFRKPPLQRQTSKKIDKNLKDHDSELKAQNIDSTQIKNMKPILKSKDDQEMRSDKVAEVSLDCISEDYFTNYCDEGDPMGVLALKAQCGTMLNVTMKGIHPINKAVLYNCRKSSKPKCSFCLSSEQSEFYGEMLHYQGGVLVAEDYNGGSKVIHAHNNCVEWAPNVYFEGDVVINLEAELARSKRIKCQCCGVKGASLGCFEKSCRKSFHVPCAKLISQCRWDDDNFVMLCSLHASSKLPIESSMSQETRRTKHAPKDKVKMLKLNQVVKSKNMSKNPNWRPDLPPLKLLLCCSALSVEEQEIMSLFAKTSGFRLSKKWDLGVTHVIASVDENGACRRTLKILMAILHGKWVLNVEWVKACTKAMKMVKEEPYEIDVDIHGIRDGPQRGRIRAIKKEAKIFNGFQFYFAGDFMASYTRYIRDLLVAGGGTILVRKPISRTIEASPFVGSLCPKTLIIYNMEIHDADGDSCKKKMAQRQSKEEAEALASSLGAQAVSDSWILDSIAAHSLQSF